MFITAVNTFCQTLEQCNGPVIIWVFSISFIRIYWFNDTRKPGLSDYTTV